VGVGVIGIDLDRGRVAAPGRDQLSGLVVLQPLLDQRLGRADVVLFAHAASGLGVVVSRGAGCR
jgi:hypothetical protein